MSHEQVPQQVLNQWQGDALLRNRGPRALPPAFASRSFSPELSCSRTWASLILMGQGQALSLPPQ